MERQGNLSQKTVMKNGIQFDQTITEQLENATYSELYGFQRLTMT